MKNWWFMTLLYPHYENPMNIQSSPSLKASLGISHQFRPAPEGTIARGPPSLTDGSLPMSACVIDGATPLSVVNCGFFVAECGSLIFFLNGIYPLP